jgi:predicted glycoside hydrolase/deacetylase ChbG (UPF0249 family)
MTDRRILIVNADDFGQSNGVNHGVIETHRQGIVTSTSLMVRQAATAAAVALSRPHPALSLGLHLDLGEWRLRDGAWVPVYGVVPLNDARAVADEVARQLESFRQLVGRDPTHIDSHQHVHLREPVRSILAGYARELSVPLRRCEEGIGYCGEFYGQDANGAPSPERISVKALLGLLERLPSGIIELCCHPAVDCDLDTMYARERCREMAALCDPRVRQAIARENIELCSFAEFRSTR